MAPGPKAHSTARGHSLGTPAHGKRATDPDRPARTRARRSRLPPTHTAQCPRAVRGSRDRLGRPARPKSRPRGVVDTLMRGRRWRDPVPAPPYHAPGFARCGGLRPAVSRPVGRVPGGPGGQAAPVRRGAPTVPPGGRSYRVSPTESASLSQWVKTGRGRKDSDQGQERKGAARVAVKT